MNVAVVILNWNGRSCLERFLPSVIAGSGDARIVVADNGSTDDSLQFLRDSYPQVNIVELDANYGFAEGYNRAIASVDDAEFVILLNSDVETPEGWIEPLVREMESDTSIGVVAPKLLSYSRRDEFEYAGGCGGYIDYLGYPFCRGRILSTMERDSGQYDDIRDVFWVSGAALCCRRELFLGLGGFAPEFFAHMEEIDFCWRVQLRGYRVVVVPSSRVYHLGGATLSNGSVRKIFLNHRNNLAMIFRCAPLAQRLLAAMLRPFLDLAASLSYLVQGNVAASLSVFAAYYDFARWHGRLRRERRQIRASRVTESGCVFHSSILWKYLTGRRRFSDLEIK